MTMYFIALTSSITVDRTQPCRQEPTGDADQITPLVVRVRLYPFVCARHGRELMGCKSPCVSILLVINFAGIVSDAPDEDPYAVMLWGWTRNASGYPIRPSSFPAGYPRPISRAT
jgi:hypothetical protein